MKTNTIAYQKPAPAPPQPAPAAAREMAPQELPEFRAAIQQIIAMEHVTLKIQEDVGVEDLNLLGSIEMFRVAPVSTRQILFGKYMAYAIFLAVMGAALVAAMFALQVPFRGDLLSFGILLLFLILALLGMGLLISIVSKSETQAVQLSTLMLLLSSFFGGFFLPLENFWLPIHTIGFMLPLTSGILGLQDIMLRGITPVLWIWVLLGALAFVTFFWVNLFAPRQLRFEQGAVKICHALSKVRGKFILIFSFC